MDAASDLENHNDDYSSSPPLETPIAEQRRKRIYETTFNRPYPETPKKEKKSLLQHLKVTPPSSSPQVSSPPSPKKQNNRQRRVISDQLPSSSSSSKPSPPQTTTTTTTTATTKTWADFDASPSSASPALDMRPCNFWEGSGASTIPPKEKLVREDTAVTRSTRSSGDDHDDIDIMMMQSSSPIDDDIDPVWISTGRKETPDVFDVVLEMKPCNLWEDSQASSVPPRHLLTRDDLLQPRPVSTSSDEGMMCSSPPAAEISRSSDDMVDDDGDGDVVFMTVTPSSPPHSKGIPSPFDISPLTYTPGEYTAGDFFEPPIPKGTSSNLVQPLLPEIKSFEDQPNMESNTSLQEFMRLSEDHTLNLYVDEIQESTFDRIIESLYGNTSLKLVTIIRSSVPVAGDYRTPQEMKCVWDAIRCLPNLQFLAVMNFRKDILHDLSDIWTTYPGCKLQLHMAEGTLSPQFLKALAQAPKLKDVQIHVNESMDVGILLESKSIRDFRVVSQEFQLDDHHMQLFADRLARNESSVQKIDLEPTLSTASMLGLAYALQHNHTLRSLQVSYDHSLGDSNAVVTELCSMLKNNRTLTELSNHCHESIWVCGETKDHLIKAMKGNGTIVLFKFFQEEPMFCVVKESVLKANKIVGGARGHAHGFASIFQKYWNCGSLMDIDMGCDIRLPV
jgi:hypothetical protein